MYGNVWDKYVGKICMGMCGINMCGNVWDKYKYVWDKYDVDKCVGGIS